MNKQPYFQNGCLASKVRNPHYGSVYHNWETNIQKGVRTLARSLSPWSFPFPKNLYNI